MWILALLLIVFIATGLYLTVGGGSTPKVFGSGPGGGVDTPNQRPE